jgi:DNA-3-methyladenine glycosylase II
MRRVTALLGDPPSAEAIARASDEELRSCGLSAAKQRAIRDLAAHALDGRLDLAALPDMPDEQVVAQLVAVRGIGRWTADMFLIFALGRPDVLPVGDLGVRSAVRASYSLAALPTATELHALAAPWRPYASAATIYLWRSLDALPPAPT